MRKLQIILIFMLIIASVKAQERESIPIVQFSELEPLLHLENDTLYIINFWATWCVPCRKELPYFEQIHKAYSNKTVNVILVSLDFVSGLETATKPFLTEKGITAPVILLNDPNSNSWINKVDSTWSGSLPATLVYTENRRKFYEQELDYNALEEIINEFTLK